jgi:hypothetical protein
MTDRSYQLVNPVITGTFQNVYEAKTPIKAADAMWTNLTEHIVSHVPRFMFTLKDISSGRHYNFEVKENDEDNSYTINKLTNLKVSKKEFDNLTDKINSYSKVCEQHGGKKKRTRYDDSSDSDSSCSPIPTLVKTSPIALFHYNPYIYYKNRTSILNPEVVAITTPIFTPIFKPTLGTFIGIWP